MLVVIDEEDRVADVFLVADLVVLCVLIERGFVLAGDGLVGVVVAPLFAADEGEF